MPIQLQKHKYVWLCLALLMLLALSIQWSGIFINITSSMPKGFYIKSKNPLQRGDVILFCLAKDIQELGIQQHYLSNNGRCNGANPLLKKIIAMPGDTVILSSVGIQVNQQHFPYRTFYRDSLQRPLQVFPRGTYRNTKGYWLIGTSDIKSWDSRYWGPVSKEQILFPIKPLLIFYN